MDFDSFDCAWPSFSSFLLRFLEAPARFLQARVESLLSIKSLELPENLQMEACGHSERICKMLTTDIARFGLPFKAGCGKDPSVGSWQSG